MNFKCDDCKSEFFDSRDGPVNCHRCSIAKKQSIKKSSFYNYVDYENDVKKEYQEIKIKHKKLLDNIEINLDEFKKEIDVLSKYVMPLKKIKKNNREFIITLLTKLESMID